MCDDAGDIPAATAEDVDIAVEAARKALTKNKGRDWSSASGAVRAKYLRAIASKVLKNMDFDSFLCLWSYFGVFYLFFKFHADKREKT